MKITKKKLRKIIKEELLKERADFDSASTGDEIVHKNIGNTTIIFNKLETVSRGRQKANMINIKGDFTVPEHLGVDPDTLAEDIIKVINRATM